MYLNKRINNISIYELYRVEVPVVVTNNPFSFKSSTGSVEKDLLFLEFVQNGPRTYWFVWVVRFFPPGWNKHRDILITFVKNIKII